MTGAMAVDEAGNELTAFHRAIGWWDGTTPLPGRVQNLDVLLGRLARETISDCYRLE